MGKFDRRLTRLETAIKRELLQRLATGFAAYYGTSVEEELQPLQEIEVILNRIAANGEDCRDDQVLHRYMSEFYERTDVEIEPVNPDEVAALRALIEEAHREPFRRWT